MHAEQQDQQDAEPEGRDAQRQGGPSGKRAVDPGVRHQGRDDRHRHAQQQPHQDGAQAQLQRGRHAGHDEVQHGLARLDGLAEIAHQRAGEPGPVLLMQRAIQAQALRNAVEDCLAPLLPPIDGGPDIAAIAELWGAPDSPAFKRISAVFLAEAPIRLAAIVTAHAAADRTKLSHEAHALAGAALNVGLPEVVRLARILEHADLTRPLAELAPDLLTLQEVAIRDFDALQALANPA
jgi:HPt (histidine-containing phosphotransfer) domain-containing protein